MVHHRRRRDADAGWGIEGSIQSDPVGFWSRPFPAIDASWQSGFPESQYDLEPWVSEMALALAWETSAKAVGLVAYR